MKTINKLGFRTVKIDNTIRFGCPDCVKSRRSLIYRAKVNNQKPSHWMMCKQHQKCIDYQHLAHQPEPDKECPQFEYYTEINETLLAIDEHRSLYQETTYNGFKYDFSEEPEDRTLKTKSKFTAKILELLGRR